MDIVENDPKNREIESGTAYVSKNTGIQSTRISSSCPIASRFTGSHIHVKSRTLVRVDAKGLNAVVSDDVDPSRNVVS